MSSSDSVITDGVEDDLHTLLRGWVQSGDDQFDLVMNPATQANEFNIKNLVKRVIPQEIRATWSDYQWVGEYRNVTGTRWGRIRVTWREDKDKGRYAFGLRKG